MQKWCRGEVVQCWCRAGAECRSAECRSAEKVQSRFRGAEVHWCGGVEMQNAEVQKCKHSHVLVDP